MLVTVLTGDQRTFMAVPGIKPKAVSMVGDHLSYIPAHSTPLLFF